MLKSYESSLPQHLEAVSARYPVLQCGFTADRRHIRAAGSGNSTHRHSSSPLVRCGYSLYPIQSRNPPVPTVLLFATGIDFY